MKLKLLLFLFVLLPSSSAWADVKIDAVNFPDAKFRDYLLDQRYGSDGVLTDAEIAAITYISVGDRNIQSLKGIEHFTALTKLQCSSNKLASLDVSKNKALGSLECYRNQLTSLDMSKNTKLTYFRCFENKLTSLNVSGCTALEHLECDRNQLTSLDMSKNTKLTHLICYDNQLTSLDVSGCTALTLLNCDENPLMKSLDVSGCTALKRLSCYDGQLTSLGVSGCTALTLLDCSNNQLTSLDVSKNKKLTSLDCYQNKIKDAGMDALVKSLPTVGKGEMHAIYSKDEGNVVNMAQVEAAHAKGWLVCYYDGKKWEYCTAIPINEENFPDEKFRSYLLGKDYGKDGQLMRSEIVAIKYIDVSSRHIQSLKGIEHFTALTELLCYSNSLKSLDVSKNTVLTSLICSFNELKSLNVSENRVLTSLQCRGNQLTSLDVSKNTNLTELSCQENQLKSLDVSENTVLDKLECYKNQLKSLDLSKNTKLRWLECYQNQIKDAGMDALVKSLPTASEGYLYAIYSKEEGNVMTTTQVAAADDKDWYVYYHNGKAWQIYAGSEEDPDGIGNVNVNDNVNDVYDLSGRRIASPRKGVNIINGRKVLVK